MNRLSTKLYCGALGTIVALTAGCGKAPDTKSTSQQGTGAIDTKPVAFVEKDPQVLIISRKKDQTIIALDFRDTKAYSPGLSLDQKRQFVMEQALHFYEEQRSGLKADVTKIRIHALSIANRDEYDKGDFRGMKELATMDSTRQLLDDASQSLKDRLGAIEWKDLR